MVLTVCQAPFQQFVRVGSPQTHCKVDSINIPMLQRRKLRHKEVIQLAKFSLHPEPGFETRKSVLLSPLAAGAARLAAQHPQVKGTEWCWVLGAGGSHAGPPRVLTEEGRGFWGLSFQQHFIQLESPSVCHLDLTFFPFIKKILFF